MGARKKILTGLAAVVAVLTFTTVLPVGEVSATTKTEAKKICKDMGGEFGGKTCTVKKYTKKKATKCEDAGGTASKKEGKLVCKWKSFTKAESSSASTTTTDADCANGVKTSILGNGGCYTDDGKGSGVYEILLIILNILTAGVGVLGVVGLVISGITYITARDNEQQVAKAKQRILQIVIGLAIFAVLYVGLNFLIPGGIFGATGDS
ncbi:hypothetical protein IJJ18_02295 [Candidatus Saccharibacteria bacterium]|nr:hypothetical protein [Candidatus Saccharibacteria bacterium]